MPTQSELRMTYIGGPTLWMQFGGLSLLTDPTFDAAGADFTTGPVTLSKIMGPALEPASLGCIDAVLLSHDHHFDNLDRTGRELLSRTAIVLTTQAGAARLGGNAKGLAPWEPIELTAPDGRVLRITATPARHGPADGDRGPVIGFVLQFADAPDEAIYVSGDTVWYEGVEEVLHRFPFIRVAVLFLGAARIPIVPSHLTFSAQEAVRVAQALPDAVIVPVHYEGWKHFSESRQDITQAFADAGIADRLRWLPPGAIAQSVTTFSSESASAGVPHRG
jgi:L-ascorbate metabolism protein UlaG (beta-lactamase superfamily)